jgi:hypothetical protein
LLQQVGLLSLAYLAAHALTPPAFFTICFQPHFQRLAFRVKTQRPCLLADHLVVGSAATRAANDGSDWVSIFIER